MCTCITNNITQQFHPRVPSHRQCPRNIPAQQHNSAQQHDTDRWSARARARLRWYDVCHLQHTHAHTHAGTRCARTLRGLRRVGSVIINAIRRRHQQLFGFVASNTPSQKKLCACPKHIDRPHHHHNLFTSTTNHPNCHRPTDSDHTTDRPNSARRARTMRDHHRRRYCWSNERFVPFVPFATPIICRRKPGSQFSLAASISKLTSASRPVSVSHPPFYCHKPTKPTNQQNTQVPIPGTRSKSEWIAITSNWSKVVKIRMDLILLNIIMVVMCLTV